MKSNKISAVYKIVNTVTGDRYVGSSKDVFSRWTSHKCPSRWKENPNSPMYQDMQKYGLDKFRFDILAPVEPEHLKQVEQEFIDLLKPTYNNYRAKGQNVERYKETKKEWSKSDRYKEYMKNYSKEYYKSDKGKEARRKGSKNYQNQLCLYNGEELTLSALYKRFSRAGIEHPAVEAKKYLQGDIKDE